MVHSTNCAVRCIYFGSLLFSSSQALSPLYFKRNMTVLFSVLTSILFARILNTPQSLTTCHMRGNATDVVVYLIANVY